MTSGYTYNYPGYYPGQPIGSPMSQSYTTNGYQASQSQQNNSGNILTVFVNSEEEVSSYPVAAGTTVLLLSFSLNKFWLKSTSTTGVPEQLREFHFEEKTVAPVQQGSVTREEFDTLTQKIDKLINDLGGTQNG